jgi:hypothetical protein
MKLLERVSFSYYQFLSIVTLGLWRDRDRGIIRLMENGNIVRSDGAKITDAMQALQ